VFDCGEGFGGTGAFGVLILAEGEVGTSIGVMG